MADGSLLQTLTDRLVDKVDESLKPDIIRWAAFYVGQDNSSPYLYLAHHGTHRGRGRVRSSPYHDLGLTKPRAS